MSSNIKDDEQAVRACFAQLGAAWEHGDADAYAAAFTEDADYIVFDGAHFKGRQQIAECHRPLFERFLKGSRLAGESMTIRFLSDTVALVHSKGALLLAGQNKPSANRASVQTFVVVKEADSWRITAFQNTRYRPFVETWKGRILSFFGLIPRNK